jgi:hypothetical protein
MELLRRTLVRLGAAGIVGCSGIPRTTIDHVGSAVCVEVAAARVHRLG